MLIKNKPFTCFWSVEFLKYVFMLCSGENDCAPVAIDNAIIIKIWSLSILHF